MSEAASVARSGTLPAGVLEGADRFGLKAHSAPTCLDDSPTLTLKQVRLFVSRRRISRLCAGFCRQGHENYATGPHLSSGRTLQEVSSNLVVSGLASISPVSSWSCFAPDHHGYRAHAFSLTDTPRRDHVGHQCSHAPGQRGAPDFDPSEQQSTLTPSHARSTAATRSIDGGRAGETRAGRSEPTSAPILPVDLTVPFTPHPRQVVAAICVFLIPIRLPPMSQAIMESGPL
jgi:hypothetical protein